MSIEQKSKYVAPSTRRVTVELEQGFMSGGSIFGPENLQDNGVSIDGHEVGNTGDYTGIGWDNDGGTRSTWGN